MCLTQPHYTMSCIPLAITGYTPALAYQVAICPCNTAKVWLARLLAKVYQLCKPVVVQGLIIKVGGLRYRVRANGMGLALGSVSGSLPRRRNLEETGATFTRAGTLILQQVSFVCITCC